MDVLTVEQKDELVEALLERTHGGRLEWVSEDPYTFGASAGHSRFLLLCQDRDDQHPFKLMIRRDDVEVQQMKTNPFTEEAWSDGIFDLYTMVKRRILGLDQLVHDVFDDLENL